MWLQCRRDGLPPDTLGAFNMKLSLEHVLVRMICLSCDNDTTVYIYLQ